MYRKRLHKSFQKSLLDNPVPKLAYDKKSKRIKALPPPLVPTQYVTLAPKPKPRRQQPVALPRNIPKVVSEKVKKLIDEIKPYYRPEAISKFAEDLKNRSIKLVKVIKRAFRNYAKTYSVKIIEKNSPSNQLYFTRNDVSIELEDNLKRDRGVKSYVNLRILMKKKKNR